MFVVDFILTTAFTVLSAAFVKSVSTAGACEVIEYPTGLAKTDSFSILLLFLIDFDAFSNE